MKYIIIAFCIFLIALAAVILIQFIFSSLKGKCCGDCCRCSCRRCGQDKSETKRENAKQHT
ncbi:hypothetical protein [Ruminococcus sp. Marseille-P6503]|uniref:hypothetical protein n=1 Tax=Ruminococcus sp. Marseille-P6503 TaxID=2364796 RepID=UPI000F53BBB8|nr:hypothetical protein [Ruminococcus sp. Marseille-P6503]